MLARKSQLHATVNKEMGMSSLERSRLIQQRTLAMRRQDHAEVAEIDAKLEQAKRSNTPVRTDSGADLLAKVNERNRKANVDAVRRAELAEAEKKKRDRKLAAMSGGTATPAADPSARLKTVPRTFTTR